MFYRYLEPDHPAHRANPNGANGSANYSTAIEELYRRMDAIVGKTMRYVDDQTILFVLSDHGFKSFQRGINLNTWLLENGYLNLKGDGREGGPYLRDIDWSRTRAYTFGLAGIYLNLKGREGQGIVAVGESDALKKELAAKLTGLRDPERDQVAIHRAYAKEEVYRGPYLDVAPDVVVGYNIGYRSSWDAALGRVGSPVFQDNLKAWSGDHCTDAALIPGVVFCNRTFEADKPGIEDMAPTALTLFGLKPPAFMEGKDLFATAAAEARS
jgi:predicted AlkP superfamily phosphohydrolase/phosphomutase